jgi:hypothetical protein
VRSVAPPAVALLAVLAGCIFVPGPDDLTDVCERSPVSPGPAYTVDGIVQYTTVLDANLTPAHARALLAAVQPDVVTLGAHAHANFSATLSPTASGWRFAGVGRAENGTVLDTYALDVADDNGTITVDPLRPVVDSVQPPESMVSAAWAVVNATPELAAAKTRTPTLVATGWSPITPSCVRLLFQDGPDDAILPASPEHPHTVAVVSLASDRVVLLQRQGWSG